MKGLGKIQSPLKKAFSFLLMSAIFLSPPPARAAVYSCRGSSADQVEYDNDTSQMRALQNQIDSDAGAKVLGNLRVQMTDLDTHRRAVVDCFNSRGETVNSANLNFDPNKATPAPTNTPTTTPTPTPTPTPTILPTELTPLYLLLENLNKELKTMQEDYAAALLVPLKIGPKTGLSATVLSTNIQALQTQISQVEDAMTQIKTGYQSMNFATEAVCNRDEERMNSLLNDATCNAITQCKNCRSAFLNTTSNLAGQTGTGRIGILGDTCQGYKAAKTSSETLVRIGDRWNSTGNICSAAGLLFFGPGQIICSFMFSNTANFSKEELKNWETENKTLLEKAAIALKEVGQYPIFSPDVRTTLTSNTGWEYVGISVSAFIGAIIAWNKSQEAWRAAFESHQTAETVGSWISQYAEDSARVDASVSACTVYAGFLLSEIKQAPPIDPGNNLPPIIQGISANDKSASNVRCGKLTGAACAAFQRITSPALTERDSIPDFSKFTSPLGKFSQNAKSSADLSKAMDLLASKGAQNKPIGDQYAILAPGLSASSVQTLNELDTSLRAYVKKSIANEKAGGRSSGASASTAGAGAAGNNGTGLFFLNNNDLNFPGKKLEASKMEAVQREIASLKPPPGDGSGISQDPARSLFKIMNDCTYRKQINQEVLYVPEALEKKRADSAVARAPSTEAELESSGAESEKAAKADEKTNENSDRKTNENSDRKTNGKPNAHLHGNSPLSPNMTPKKSRARKSTGAF